MTDNNPSRPDEKFDYRDIAASNVSGSTAGASSGDFHVYRQQRRRELDRIERMERAAKEKDDSEARQTEEMARKLKEETLTQKRAAKRKRKRELRNERKRQRGRPKDANTTNAETLFKEELKTDDAEGDKSQTRPLKAGADSAA